MGFYVSDTSTNMKLVEQVRCCDTGDLCNYPNTAARAQTQAYFLPLVLALCAVVVSSFR